MKTQIVDYEASMRPEWEVMVSTYWIQDLGESGTTETIREICDMVEQQWESSMVSVAVLQSEGKSIGFCVYQIDTPASDWCKRQGWGMLREFYVEKSYRGRGFGKAVFKELARIAKERKCGRLEWWCLDWNKPSIDFYLSIGAEPMDEWTVYRVAGDALDKLSK